MKNLATVFKDKTLEELVIKNEKPKVEPLEPTLAEKRAILAALVEGKTYKEIKKEVRRVEKEKRTRPKYKQVVDSETGMAETVEDGTEEYDHQLSAKGFSYGQIKEIDMARLAKIAELTPAVEAKEL